MFGSASPKESENEQEFNTASPSSTSTTEPSISPTNTEPISNSSESAEDMTGSEKRTGTSPSQTGADKPSTGEKKRRSSGGVQSKASSFLASAKNSLLFSPHPNSGVHAKGSEQNMQTPLQKLGKQDPALSVPQGQHNNSAGESLPSPRSTFRVGVWEDKNKKCRRTMEDTHAFLYNFLSTPAPAIKLDKDTSVNEESQKSGEEAGAGNEPAQVSPSSDIMETDNGYFAIFDGHAGTFAADWCGKKLHIILQDFIRKNPNAPIPEMFDQTYTNVDSQLEKLPLKNSGCTAVTAVLRWEDRIPNAQSATGSSAIAPATAAAVKAAEEALKAEEKASDAVIDASKAASPQTNSTSASTGEAAHAKLKSTATRQRVLYTANVGDARIVLCRNGKALRLSYDHKGSDENEGKRVANAGGLILNNRVNGVLAVTRALGDAYMKDLVTGHPYTTETVIQPDLDEFIILACDGLWDVCSDQDAVDLVRNIQDPVVASKSLVDHALARFSTDNLSCMIVRFNKNAILESTSTPIGVEGDEMMGGTISEVDKIVGDATRKSKEGGQTIGVSGSNSGKGMEPKSIVTNAATGEQIEERSGLTSMESVAEEEGEGEKVRTETEG